MSEIIIRRAEDKDLIRVNELLHQVLHIHAEIRPDIFIDGTTKYTDEELLSMFRNDNAPIFVAEADGTVAGYAFTILKKRLHNTNMQDIKTLFIDDLCVDEAYRSHHVGNALLKYVENYARSIGCYNITLNVWAGNDKAIGFYEHEGMQVQETVMEKILK